jgi:Skp family chaperone for outer membrane proteins
MKKSFITTVALFALAAGSQVFAQPAKPQTTPAQPQTSPANVNIPVSKVAVIFSAAFQDPKQGIAKFNVLLNQLNSKYQKTQDDLNNTAKTLNALQDEITKLQNSAAPVSPQTVQQKLDQLDQMKKDYQRRGEDAQAAYQKERQLIFQPLQDDVGKALDAFAKARGITLVIDASQVDGILYAADGIDITKAFIADYNSKNPATASIATPRP